MQLVSKRLDLCIWVYSSVLNPACSVLRISLKVLILCSAKLALEDGPKAKTTIAIEPEMALRAHLRPGLAYFGLIRCSCISMYYIILTLATIPLIELLESVSIFLKQND